MNDKNKIIFPIIFLVGLAAGFLLKAALDNTNTSVKLSQSRGARVSDEDENSNELEPAISLINYRFDKETDFAYLRGEVKNISNSNLASVEVVGNVYDKNNQFIDSARGYIELSPLMAGQSSAFKVMFKLKPEMYVAKVSGFRSGSVQVPFRDDFVQEEEPRKNK